MKKVFLDELPKWGSGKGSGRGVEGTINWIKSVGSSVHFIYNDIEGDIEIVAYNNKNRNIIIKYKDNYPYEMTACAFRECRLGGLLKNEIEFQYNENNPRRIDLRYFTKTKNGGIDWKNSINREINFNYDDLTGFLKILKYNPKGQRITLEYNSNIKTIATSDLLQCKIGNIIGKWNTDFIYKIGDILSINCANIEIIECLRKYEKSHNGYMKWYKYKCISCGWDKGEIRENDLKKNKGSCPKCGDGHSYPNKIAFNLLTQLNINFIPEYSPKWIKPKRYDYYFEIGKNKYILEMDGNFHNINNYLSGDSVDKIKNTDKYKDDMAFLHNIKIIRIDCSVSDLEFIKNNIIQSELNNILNLNNVNWIECHRFASHSRIFEACEIYNKGNKSPNKIAIEMKLSNTTIRKFLKIGVELGICDYNPKQSKEEGNKRVIKNIITKLSKKVICLNTAEIFNSISIAEQKYSCCKISECCRAIRLTSGKHPETGEPLRWMYYEDYIIDNNVIQEECI